MYQEYHHSSLCMADILLLLINTLLQPTPKYVGTQLHRQDLEQMYIVMHQAVKILRKARNK